MERRPALRDALGVESTGHVAGIIEAQFPDLLPARVTYLGEGCDNAAFEVNARWVFRFPKRPDSEQQLLLEARVLPALSRQTALPIPAFRFHGKPSSVFPRHFVGYPKLPGAPAILFDPADVPFARLAPGIGRFLSSVHSFSIDEAIRLGVERQDLRSLVDEVTVDALDDFELLNTVTPDSPLETWHAYLKNGPGPLTPSTSSPCFVHHDLAAEHILCSPETKAITGVIDWSEMAVSDRCVDFAGMFHWGGRAFLDAVLSAYRGPVDDALVPRARFLAACRGVADVRFGCDTGRREYVAAGIRALEHTAGRTGG